MESTPRSSLQTVHRTPRSSVGTVEAVKMLDVSVWKPLLPGLASSTAKGDFRSSPRTTWENLYQLFPPQRPCSSLSGEWTSDVVGHVVRHAMECEEYYREDA